MDHVSLWQQTTSCRLPTVALPASAEAVIVGGGLCGLLTAYRLLQRGVNDIVVMDAGDIAGGVTAHTTAKITAQHGLCYQKLLQERGATAAAQYAAAAREAERAFPTLIRQLNIDCGYTPCPAAVYATDTDGARRLEQEAEALARLQLPFTADRTADLPFAVPAVLHTTGGGYFHPLQFAYALTDHLRRQGVTFCPRTAAVGLSEEAVVTTRGRVRTPVAVLTSHFPFLDMPGRYFMRIWQERAYVLAVAQVKPPAEMYWGAGKHDLSLRPYPNGVLIGGGPHRTGRFVNAAAEYFKEPFSPAVPAAGAVGTVVSRSPRGCRMVRTGLHDPRRCAVYRAIYPGGSTAHGGISGDRFQQMGHDRQHDCRRDFGGQHHRCLAVLCRGVFARPSHRHPQSVLCQQRAGAAPLYRRLRPRAAGIACLAASR